MIKETLLVSTFGLLGLVTVACGSQKKDQTAEAVSEIGRASCRERV